MRRRIFMFDSISVGREYSYRTEMIQIQILQNVVTTKIKMLLVLYKIESGFTFEY